MGNATESACTLCIDAGSLWVFDLTAGAGTENYWGMGAESPSRGACGRLDVTLPPQRTPFIGREVELAILRERAGQGRQGLGQVVLLSGDVRIGKSRLMQEVTTTLAADSFTCLDFRCSPYAQHTALHPVIAWLQRHMRDDAETPVSERLACLENALHRTRLDLPEGLPLVAALPSLPLPEARSPALHLTPQRQRQRTLETLGETRTKL
jgi:hypothetical protein